MAHKLRLQYPGAIYHVMNRGDRRDPILDDDQDPHHFLEALTQACQKTGWQVLAYFLSGISAAVVGTGEHGARAEPLWGGGTGGRGGAG